MIRLCCRKARSLSQKHALQLFRCSSKASSFAVKQVFDQNRVETYKFAPVDADSTKPAGGIHKESVTRSVYETTQRIVRDTVVYLLPKGYPSSVRSGYSTFITGQLVSNTLSTAGGVLSMQALLYAMGIGMSLGAGAAPLAATLNWVIKDGLGQLGGVIFAGFVSNRFDADPKRWRLTATIAMDSASFIELLTPLAPAYFLPIASVANISKNISFLAASATRAAIHKSFALQENLADVTAKTGSQYIVSSLLGTSLGVSLSTLVTAGITGASAQYEATVGLYCLLSSVSIAVTYWSLRYVTITSLSQKRLDYLLHSYLAPLLAVLPVPAPSSHSGSYDGNTDTVATTTTASVDIPLNSDLASRQYWAERELVTPDQLRLVESLLGVPQLPQLPSSTHGAHTTHTTHSTVLPPLRVGCNIDEVILCPQEYQMLAELYARDQFIINAVTTQEDINKSAEVYVLFKEHASAEDIVRGLMQAFVVRSMLHRAGYTSSNSSAFSKVHDKIFNTQNSDKRVQNVDVLKAANVWIQSCSTDEEMESGNIAVGEVCNTLVNKIMHDKDWKISNTMLETRFARICA